MSKLEQLIKELCPNGVEYKKLGEVATISRGGSFQKKDFTEDGVPCIHYGQIYTRYGLFADKTLSFISKDTAQKQKYAVKNDIVMAVTSENIDDVCKCLAWLGEDSIAVSGHSAIIHHTLNPKYLCYYFHTAMFYAQKKKLAHGTKVIEVTPDKLADITIPVPPLEVQAEIVKILDEYTESVTALQQELEAELTARKKQYEYYRDLLLDFGVHGGGASEHEWHTLGEICSITDGSHFSPKEVAEGYYMPSVKDMRNNDFDFSLCKKISRADYELLVRNGCRPQTNDVLIAKDGATMLKHAFVASGTEDIVILSSIAILRPNTDIIFPKYLAHYFRQEGFKEMVIRNYSSVGGVPRIVLKNFKRIKIAIPPMKEQTRIVSILDRFDKLCNDISEGLPAEIEARRKQYEYYRDKLLSFEEKCNGT